MNIIYVDSTEVPFDSIVEGQCFVSNGKVYMKIFQTYPDVKLNAVNMSSGVAIFFEDDYSVTPVYAELYITGYNKEKT